MSLPYILVFLFFSGGCFFFKQTYLNHRSFRRAAEFPYVNHRSFRRAAEFPLFFSLRFYFQAADFLWKVLCDAGEVPEAVKELEGKELGGKAGWERIGSREYLGLFGFTR